MADTPDTLPTKEELAQLPVRAIVAYAARCARRVQPLYNTVLTPTMPAEELKEHCLAIDRAVTLAERWARCESVSTLDFRIAGDAIDNADYSYGQRAAAFAAYTGGRAAAADALGNVNALVAEAAAAAAADADDAAPNADAANAARRDFEMLKARRFKPDAPVDASESGPCGELWIDEPPDWYTQGQEQLRKLGVLKKLSRRKTSPPAANTEELQKLRALQEQLQRDRKNLESDLQIARAEAADYREMIDKADALSHNQEQARLKEAESHQKTREEVQNLQRGRLELQEQLNASLSRIADHELELLKVRGELAQVEQRNETLIVQPLGWYGEKLFCPQSMFQLLTLTALGAMVMFALFGIGEVYERQALDRWIKAQVETQRERLIDRGPVERQSPSRLESLEAIRSQLLILSLAGASTRDETIVGVRDQLKALQQESSGLLPIPSVAMGPPGWWPLLRYQSSDLLLSLVVLISATIGAAISAVRRNNSFSFRDLGLGVSAGFTTFLIVRGGKSVFLVDADPLPLINPYNSAFFGMLAGMFTELTFGLLGTFAKKFADRLQMAVDLVFSEPLPPYEKRPKPDTPPDPEKQNKP